MAENKKFPLEKILTVDMKDYIASKGKGFSDYELVGVHYNCELTKNKDIYDNLVVPENTEVLLINQTTSCLSGAGSGIGLFYAGGTALVPKVNKK